MTERTVIINSAAMQAVGGFAPLPNNILACPWLSFGAKCAYGKLLAYAWEKDFAAPAQERLARDLGLGDERQVRRLLAELRGATLLEWHRRGQGRPNLYVVNLPDNLSAQDRTDVSGQTEAERTDVSGLERTDVSAPSVQEKKGRDKELLRLSSGPPDNPSGSRKWRKGVDQPAQTTWLQELNEDHVAKCGGGFSKFGAVGKVLKPLHERLGPDLRRRWQYYLERTEVTFVSAFRFAETIGGYNPPAGWQPGTPAPPPHRGGPVDDPRHPDYRPAEGDKWDEDRRISEEQERRLGLR